MPNAAWLINMYLCSCGQSHAYLSPETVCFSNMKHSLLRLVLLGIWLVLRRNLNEIILLKVEKSDPDSHPPGFRSQTSTTPTSQLEEIKWFYTDPQGKMQGWG